MTKKGILNSRSGAKDYGGSQAYSVNVNSNHNESIINEFDQSTNTGIINIQQ